LRAIAALASPTAANSTILALVTWRCCAVGRRATALSKRRCGAVSVTTNGLRPPPRATIPPSHQPAPPAGAGSCGVRAHRPLADGPDAAAELLLVAASAYGDLGQPAAGVALIRRHARWPVELADHHLRLAYAEGALAERAGDLARARDAFARVVRADPDFHDAAERLDHLGAS
jgi:hypothetical protein